LGQNLEAERGKCQLYPEIRGVRLGVEVCITENLLRSFTLVFMPCFNIVTHGQNI